MECSDEESSESFLKKSKNSVYPAEDTIIFLHI